MTGQPRLLPKRGFTEQVYIARRGEKRETLIRLLTDQKERLRGRGDVGLQGRDVNWTGRRGQCDVDPELQRFCGATVSPTPNLLFLALVRKGEEGGWTKDNIKLLRPPPFPPFSRIEEVENAKKIDALALAGCTKWFTNHI